MPFRKRLPKSPGLRPWSSHGAQPYVISWVLRKGIATSSHQGAKPRREALFALGKRSQEFRSNCRWAVPPDVRMWLGPSGRDSPKSLGLRPWSGLSGSATYRRCLERLQLIRSTSTSNGSSSEEPRCQIRALDQRYSVAPPTSSPRTGFR